MKLIVTFGGSRERPVAPFPPPSTSAHNFLNLMLFGGGENLAKLHVGVNGGECVAGGVAEVCMVGACMAGGVRGGGGRRAWQERRPLQLTVRILLECILVINSSNQSGSVAERLCDVETSGETFREM